jgi:hypothetical protein
MPATLPINMGPNTQYNNLNVRGIISELNGNSMQWNNAYLTLFGSEYIQLGSDFNITTGEITAISINSDGDRIAAGVKLNSTTSVTRIYQWNGTAWSQQGLDIANEFSGDQSGWSVSLNSAGNRIAIGSPENDGTTGNASDNRGNVRIYEWNNTVWAKIGALDIDGEAAGDQSGWSVSLNAVGDRVAIGAILNDGTGSASDNRGHTRVYEFDGTAWTRMGSLDLDGEAAGDQSGWSVSLNAVGDRVAIGAILNDGTGSASDNRGQVRIYQWDGDVWTRMGSLDLDGEAAGDQSGWSVSLNAAGDRVAIGSPYNDAESGTNRGRVVVYQWTGGVTSTGSWIQQGLDLNGEINNDESGISVALNAVGDRVIIGSRLNDSGFSNSGHIRIYQWDGSRWIRLRDIDGIANNDYLGSDVAVNAVGDIICSNSHNSISVFTNSSRILSSRWNNNTTGKTIFVDSLIGSDSRINTTAYNEHRPFATISAAVTASTQGDLIYVRAGSYAISAQINLNLKGHLYFETGATVSVATGVVAFSYSQNNTAIYIKGHADFVLTGSAGVLTMPSGNATTAVAFECNSVSGPSNVSGTLFSCAAGALSVDAKVIRMNATSPFTASSATVFNITGSGKVITRIPLVYCGVFVNGAGAANAGDTAGAQINADVWILETYNATAGMNLSLITTNFRIVNYNHVGVGAAFSWTENATVESHAFQGVTWSSAIGQAQMTFASTADSTTTKRINLQQTNILRAAATNSLSSSLPIEVYTYGSFATAPANSNITFKVGAFTVDASA